MGLVLAFQTAPRPASRSPSPRREKAAGADILFFTGIRYERHSGAPSAEPASSAQRPVGVPPVS